MRIEVLYPTNYYNPPEEPELTKREEMEALNCFQLFHQLNEEGQKDVKAILIDEIKSYKFNYLMEAIEFYNGKEIWKEFYNELKETMIEKILNK